MLLNYLQWLSLLQMTADDLSKVLKEPTDEQSSHSAGRNHNLLNLKKVTMKLCLLVDLPL